MDFFGAILQHNNKMLWKEYLARIRKCEFGSALTLEVDQWPIGVFRMTLSCYYPKIPRSTSLTDLIWPTKKRKFFSTKKCT
jgi:hypothetical protein